MANISDHELFSQTSKVKGQTVIITGGGNGIGRATSIAFGTNGAKVVIGDIDIRGAEETVEEIRAAGGQAIFTKCDVSSWEELNALFDLALSHFGSVDVVIPNAGITELPGYTVTKTDAAGKLIPPNLKTLDLNLKSVLNTAHMAIHYLKNYHKKPNSVKAIVFIGSMSSISPLGLAPVYTTAKHGVLGLARALYPSLQLDGIRVTTVTPWFADTAILSPAMKILLAGIPMTPIGRIAGAAFLAATDDEETNGSVYTLPDDLEVFRVPFEEVNQGIYGLLNKRVTRLINIAVSIKMTLSFWRSVWGFQGVRFLTYFIFAVVISQVAIYKEWV